MAIQIIWSLAVFLLFGAFSVPGVNSKCPSKCSVNLLNVWPGNGYHARIQITSPILIRAFSFARIFFHFDGDVSRIENIHVQGGIVREIRVKYDKKKVTFLFRPDQNVGKGKKLTMEFYVRQSGSSPKLIEVKFWKRVSCSNIPCTVSTTPKPSTAQTVPPTQFSSCSTVQKLLQVGPGFFKVKLLLPVSQVLNGWEIELQFTKPVLGISNFDANLIEVRRQMYFRLENFRHNKELQPGTFSIILMVHYQHSMSKPPKIALIKFRSFRCQGNDALTVVPTQTAPTSEPTTTQKLTAKPTRTKATTDKTPGQTTQTVTTVGQTTLLSTVKLSTDKRTTSGTMATVAPGCVPKYDYSKVLQLSLLFYEAQRSGKLPKSNRIPYRGDSALNDGRDVGKDLSGGYYDAGDFVKFGFPMAYTITVLSWGVIQYGPGYKAAGQYRYALDAIKWGTDYLIKCHTAPNELYGQVGDGDVDHAYWGRPEEMKMHRPSMKIDSTKPGSDLAGETAAALAAASIVFKDDATYSATLITHARELYDFASTYRRTYSNSIPNAAKFYRSYSGYKDELTWAAAWLYRATKEQRYLQDARSFYTQFGMSSLANEFSWDDKKAGAQVLMAQITGENSFKHNTEAFCDAILRKQRTPKGLVFISQWGSNRHAANVAFICLMAGDLGIKTSTYRTFARSQIHYILGDAGRSFVVGFGNNPPQRPHHGSSSCPNRPASCGWSDYNSRNPNPQTLYGALVGGPDSNDNYADVRSDYVKNEVACDYNAGFQSAVAALRQLQSKGEC